MPKGVRKVKPEAVVAEEAVTSSPAAVAVVAETPKEKPVEKTVFKEPSEAEKIAESRKVLDVPLDENQEFYESPEGHIVIGEKGRGRAWCRAANKGQGMWINPRR